MNKTLVAAVSKIPVILCASILTTAAAAQGVGSVVESQGFTPGQSPQTTQSAAGTAAPNTDALSLLLEQNQQLRAEVQALRALIEEQGFEVRKLQRDSLNRYTNVDDRLSALESGGAANPSGPATAGIGPGLTTPTPAIPATTIDDNRPAISLGNSRELDRATPPPRTSSRPTLQPAVLSEQQLYQMAYDSVINSNFERSVAEFDQYLSIYPEGRFVTNAYYWKGQAYLYLNRFAEARDSYEIILNQHGDSAKLPDAMYGLGLAYQGLGNIAQARQLLNEIKRRFPNTGVANLADTRLLSL